MNDLSWFLYFAGLIDNLSVFLSFFTILSSFSLIGWAIINGVENDWEDYLGPKWLFSIPIVASLILVLIPSTETIYAIAASEMGEEVLKSSTATKAQKALDAWLDKQIESVDNND